MTIRPKTIFLTALLATSVLAVGVSTPASAMDIGAALAGGEGSRSFLGGGAIGGPAQGAMNFGQSGWGVATQHADSNGTSAVQGHAGPAGTTSENFLSDNAFSEAEPGGHAINKKHALHGPKDHLAPHHKKPGHDMFGGFARFPELPGEPRAEAPAEPPPPIGELADLPPSALQEAVRALDDDEQSEFNQSCQDILMDPAGYDQDAVRVCWVSGSF